MQRIMIAPRAWRHAPPDLANRVRQPSPFQVSSSFAWTQANIPGIRAMMRARAPVACTSLKPNDRGGNHGRTNHQPPQLPGGITRRARWRSRGAGRMRAQAQAKGGKSGQTPTLTRRVGATSRDARRHRRTLGSRPRGGRRRQRRLVPATTAAQHGAKVIVLERAATSPPHARLSARSTPRWSPTISKTSPHCWNHANQTQAGDASMLLQTCREVWRDDRMDEGDA